MSRTKGGASASAAAKDTTITGRGALAARWQTSSATARLDNPRLLYELIPRDAGKYLATCLVKGMSCAQIAEDCGVSRAAVSKELAQLRGALDGCTSYDLTDDDVGALLWCFRNEEAAYRPRPVRAGSLHDEKWTKKPATVEAASPSPTSPHKRIAKIIAAEEDGARRDIARHFNVPRSGRGPVDSTALPEGGWHTTGTKGEGRVLADPSDRATDRFLAEHGYERDGGPVDAPAVASCTTGEEPDLQPV